MRYAILLEPTRTGFSAHVPDLPGCVAAGETREETLDLIREAIQTFHLEGTPLDGQLIPDPASTCESVEVSGPREHPDASLSHQIAADITRSAAARLRRRTGRGGRRSCPYRQWLPPGSPRASHAR